MGEIEDDLVKLKGYMRKYFSNEVVEELEGYLDAVDKELAKVGKKVVVE